MGNRGTSQTKIQQADRVGVIEQFFETKLPDHIKNNVNDQHILSRIDKKQIMNIVDFTPPFLRIEKMIVFGNEEQIIGTRSIGMGIISQKDTDGHYNKTIYLAMCGWLMASSASIHLGVLYPKTAPQVVKADGVMPLQLPNNKKGLWQPSFDGTAFFVETQIKNKKLQLAIAETKISFGDILYGTIEDLKLVLTPKQSILATKTLPPYIRKKG
ncbi:MAG: hypothetical protein KJ995_06830 [Candidatus Omnitrophica bacterium]|nr:hypothetical protein [Candidatus Omnitrophota bacterium]MBU1128497.1 hypothetical protein [Candidatus Omnitrophota bacterium]MBU1784858.1 hypothetical protein [Candidatus Omnitrophota bacterium]MBU1852097.1 hypothetical protein [Candidatus Omnitrophota bacterium]